MTIRSKVLYPTDEISARGPDATTVLQTRAQRRRRQRNQQETPLQVLNAGPANYESGPSKDWEQAHDAWHGRLAPINCPVPRLASHHYFGVDKNTQAIYFY